jgi:predicted membrane channel-forming protein YqfA (hemolysin III family)
MTKNPIVNALAGLLYIAAVVSLIFYAPQFVQEEDSIFIPIAMLSLFVFSAATMSYLFLYQPLCLLVDGKKQEAAMSFIQTLAMFAISAAAFLLIGVYFLT